MDKKTSVYKLDTATWSVERIVFLIAGIFILLSLALSFWIDQRFVYFTFFVGAMLVNFAWSGYCPMAILVDKIKNTRR